LIKLFQKFAQVEGAKPSSLVATSETSLMAFFGSFLRLLAQKRTERINSMCPMRCYVSKPSPFFLAKLPQKEPKTAFLEFRLCGGDSGLCPKTPQTFEKV
jgi:hypothetical protein